MIQAVIFDVGGVLLRTEDRAPRQAWEARLGLEPGGAEALVFNSEMGQKA
jgi:beta-phosphoglucomutase-like phosphatase (HAD superfamily)